MRYINPRFTYLLTHNDAPYALAVTLEVVNPTVCLVNGSVSPRPEGDQGVERDISQPSRVLI